MPLKSQKRPLAGYTLLASSDPGLVRSTVGNAICDFRMSALGTGVALDAHFHGLRLSCGGLYYLDYGTDVRIDPRQCDDFYMIQVPLAGRTLVSSGSETFVSTPERAFVLQPGRQMSLEVEGVNRNLLLRLDRVSIHHVLRKKLGREPAAPILFDPQMDLTTPGNKSFRGLLSLFVEAVDAAAEPSTIAVREFEGLLISQLILGQPNNYRDELDRKPRATVARPIARAVELIEAHAHEPLTVDDIAYAVGIGPRALQDGFRRYYNTTPTAYLREIRLHRVRTELLQADPTVTTVTDVAVRWGFLHLGRFSAAYSRRFGETPSQTLRLATDRSLMAATVSA
ncbi:AraC-like ligand-binding domain-containing protein [Nocardia sp. R7R-8]|uniref:AraC-like ligand-binding domain-containing protein n=1 Tax=Nocardia sp. R7R-8 TaxID=3459304 RepID=UPI00403DEC37